MYTGISDRLKNDDYPTGTKPKTLIKFPAEMLRKVDTVAVAEHRTRTSLVLEACRRYLSSYEVRHGIEL